MIVIPEGVVKHVLKKHRDFVVMLRVRDVDELKRVIREVVENPDEVHVDAYGVRYFLKRINDKWINIIVTGDSVKTAYIIGLRTYLRLRERRWR